MTINRWAARSDANRNAVAQVFRDHGWTVYDLRTPVDLLCGKNGVTLLVEVKRDERAKHTPAQVKFLASWKGGPVLTIRDEQGAETAARDDMTHRTDRVWIPDDEERCNPMYYCQDKLKCGRYLAPIKQGSAMGDHSRALGVLFMHCPHLLPLNMKPQKPAPEVKDWPT